MGFPRRIAEQIVLQTVSGSVAFARDSGKHMAELRNMVTSPGGTSAEAIYQMEKGGCARSSPVPSTPPTSAPGHANRERVDRG